MSASYATVADVKALAKGLRDVDIDQLTLIVDVISRNMVDPGTWGDRLSEAHRLMAAHVATVQLDPSGATGATTSRSMGQISESYQTTAISDAELGRTVYGRGYLLMRRKLKRSMSYSAADRGWDDPGGSVP